MADIVSCVFAGTDHSLSAFHCAVFQEAMEQKRLMCPAVLVEMSVCPVIMLFLTVHQVHGSIADIQGQLNWLLEGRRNDIERHERLSLGSDCTEHRKSQKKIMDFTAADNM